MDEPLLDVRLFASRAFSAAVAAVVVAMATIAIVLFLLTQYFQMAQGLSPFDAGVRLLPMTLTLLAAAPAASGLINRFGIRTVIVGGLLLVALGALLLGLSASGDYGWVATALALMGTGGGAMFTASSVTLMAAVPPPKAGSAAAIDEMSFELGGALGIAVLGSMAATLFRNSVANVTSGLPARVAEHRPEEGAHLAQAAKTAFAESFATTSLISAGAMTAITLLAALLIPRAFAPGDHQDEAGHRSASRPRA